MPKMSFAEWAEYNDEWNDAYEELGYFADSLFMRMINISTKGCWREWDNEQELGTVFQFTEEMFRECPDATVQTLAHIYRNVQDFLDENKEKYTPCPDKISLYEDSKDKACRRYIDAEINGSNMIVEVDEHGPAEDDGLWDGYCKLQDISVEKLKKALNADSDRDLWRKMKEQFGVRDGDKLLQQFMDKHNIYYKVWSEWE